MTEERVWTEKQQRVLDAALEMFAERGYAGVATKEIAERAGVAEGTIFKAWKTKKDLLIAVVAPVFFRLQAPRLMAEVRELFERPWPDAESLLRELLTNRMAFVRQHQRWLRVVAQELPFHPELRTLAVSSMKESVWPSMQRTWQRLQREGKVRADVPAHVIMRNIAGAFIAWFFVRVVLDAERPWKDAEEETHLLTLLLDGVRPR